MHKKQLDGLRFIAFLLVFLFHLVDGMPEWFGPMGVNLFFALSGFLITRILLIFETGSLKHDLGMFYIRRTLRIFPVYYLFCAALFFGGWLPYAVWHFTYLWNVKEYLLGHASTLVNHFWSLCVEEQFYLSFPPILLCTPKEHRLKLIIGLIFSSLTCNLLFILYDPNSLYRLLLPTRGLFLLLGCLAGYLELLPQTKNVAGTKLFLGAVAIVGLLTLCGDDIQFRIVVESLTAIGLAAIVFGLWRSTNPLLVGILSFPPIAYLGKISYGLYLFHWISLPIWLTIIRLAPSTQNVYQPIGCFIVTVVISALSWHLIESPINGLKKRFAYGKTISQPSAVA